jgi:cation:H+ antiporter
MVDAIFALLGGLALAGAGGEFFVRGVVGIAHWARIPSGIVAVTIAAFATSSPELSVSLNAALAGTPEIGLGDAIGSNVVNVGFILGVALLMGELAHDMKSVRRDLSVAALAPVATALLALDGTVSRADGALMLLAFGAWLALVVRDAWAQRTAVAAIGERKHGLALVLSLAGLGMLVLAGRLIVHGATTIGEALGMTPFAIGATMVAVGTSIPELATTLISRWRGHEEIGLGTVFGSNIFNGLLIVGTVAVVHPITLQGRGVLVGLGFGLLTVLLTIPWQSGRLGRIRGGMLLLAYASFVALQLLTGPEAAGV